MENIYEEKKIDMYKRFFLSECELSKHNWWFKTMFKQVINSGIENLMFRNALSL